MCVASGVTGARHQANALAALLNIQVGVSPFLGLHQIVIGKLPCGFWGFP